MRQNRPLRDEDGGAGKGRCWFCRRPLGRRIEWHHPLPKSRGGRETVPLHPICHRTLHARFSNAELARIAAAETDTLDVLRAQPDMARFLEWVAGKPPDFHARTAIPRK